MGPFSLRGMMAARGSGIRARAFAGGVSLRALAKKPKPAHVLNPRQGVLY